MIDSIDLSESPCFGSGVSLGDLAPVNYVFGPNGSGKTTISQGLAGTAIDDTHIDWEQGAQTVKVYNRNYVRKAFTSADGEERGVFLLGTESAEIFEKIKELEAQQEKTNRKIKSRQDTIEREETEKRTRREQTANRVWERRSAIPDTIRRQMTGLNGGKSKCLDLAIENAHAFPERGDENFESLTPKAEVAFSESISERAPIPPAPAITWDESALHTALATPIIGSADVPLAELINRLAISDWARQGIDHLHAQGDSPQLCPFCQQTIPKDLENQLASIFDDTYQTRRNEIEVFRQSLTNAQSSLSSFKQEHFHDLQEIIDADKVEKAFDAAEVSLESIIKSVEQKTTNPSSALDATSPLELYSALEGIVEEANRAITETNSIVQDRKSQRSTILSSAWQEFVRGHLDDLLTTYFEAEEKSDAKINAIREGIAEQNRYLQEAEKDLRVLRAQSTSSEGTIQTINNLLEMSQFHSFKLEKARETDDGYRIVRENGETANVDSLSEGERTFITFLYFYHSLAEVRQDGETEHTTAVIDDPVSSLDGDIMFVVSALTRDLVRRVRKRDHDRVSQIILLTHNTRFHNEVSYDHKGQEATDVKFYRIRKFAPNPNQIEDCGVKNPIRSAYQELWDEVVTANAEPDASMPWLPNILRRILESYFSTLGGQGNLYEIGEDLETPERALHDALIAWSHSGSHTIIDAEVYAQPLTSNSRWLNAFVRIFERAAEGAHKGHYEMMVSEARKHVS